jgi:outer membrane receptor protein involved in Fe transport
MKLIVHSFLVSVLLMMTSLSVYSQSTLSGTVKDKESGETLVGVSLIIKGKVQGTTSDINGNFKIQTNLALPLKLVVTLVGYKSVEVDVTDASAAIDIQLEESSILHDEVVISASRIEESIMSSPVSIEKMDIIAVKEAPSDNYYKGLAALKGVDVSTSSIGFQIINTRGFNSTGNTRFVQMTDGMDTQAPGLNFPIGNLNGPSEIDVESVELIPGASSALYGPNAFNGILLVTSKNPFQYKGLSAFAKLGANHINGNSLEPGSPQPLYEGSIRYANTLFNEKLGFKIHASYFGANDWHGTDLSDQNIASQGALPFNPGANQLHILGDEVSTNLALLGFSSGARSIIAGQGLGAFLPLLPNTPVSRTGYLEKDLVDYNAKNLKLNGALHYRLSSSIEAIYNFNMGAGTSVYTGANRYSLQNFNIMQHKLELKGDNFFIRGYTTQERSGDSYDANFLGIGINRQWRSDSEWFVTYATAYLGSLAQQGVDINTFNLLPERRNAFMTTAHQTARSAADQGRYLPGSAEFNKARDLVKSSEVPKGAKFNDATNLYHGEFQYNFKNEIKFMDVIAGASYRFYELNSNGTIFPDSAGNRITIYEYGGFVQASKKLMNEKLKLTASLRYDKNENFDGQWNPRFSAVYTLKEKHNFRASFQTGFRMPTTQAQHISLGVGAFRLLGGLPFYAQNVPVYNSNGQLVRTTNITENTFTINSVNAYTAAVIASGSSLGVVDPKNIALLQPYTEFRPVKPERVESYEIGYKSLLFNNKLMVDFAYYRSDFYDFITQIRVRQAAGFVPTGSNIDPTDPRLANAQTLLSGSEENTFQIYTNATEVFRAQGFAAGAAYSFPKGYTLSGNYNWNELFKGSNTTGFMTEFNTPAHKFNLSLSNRKVIKNLGFSVNYRWQDRLLWESSFAIGKIPAFHNFDAQLSYKVSSIKSVVRLGASNLTNNRYFQNLGGPTLGAIYYVSITFDELLK